MGALREVSSETQAILTTHSPDLVDQVDLKKDSLLVVQSHEGASQIARVDPASAEAISERRYTSGDLLRLDQLQPDRSHIEDQTLLLPFAEPV